MPWSVEVCLAGAEQRWEFRIPTRPPLTAPGLGQGRVPSHMGDLGAHSQGRLVKVPAPQAAFPDTTQQVGELGKKALLWPESGLPPPAQVFADMNQGRAIVFPCLVGVGQLMSKSFLS